jgi:hypothetical protein
MSYDLVFWKQTPLETKSPQEILDAIATGQDPIEGLQTLTIESFVSRCLEVFPFARRERNGDHEWIVLDQPELPWSFQAEWSRIHIWVTLRGDWSGDTANQLIDLASEIDCPLFDPQTSERFT